MRLAIPTTEPFSFAQTLAFIERFPPCRDEYVMTENSLTAAISIGGKPYAFTLRDGRSIDVADATPRAVANELATRAAQFIGANDDLKAFYAATRGDEPMQRVVKLLHGLHHVRFLTLGEIAVYSVMMQRSPMTIAGTYKRRFTEAFGAPVTVDGHTLRAWPSLDELVTLSTSDVARALRHRPKAERIAQVVRGVHALGETFLREAPYAKARDALIEIPGVGPFAAGAILLRGLGRMDELPWSDRFVNEAKPLYGRRVSQAEIEKRYGSSIGYWSFYMMTGTPRLTA